MVMTTGAGSLLDLERPVVRSGSPGRKRPREFYPAALTILGLASIAAVTGRTIGA
jgi:hypothetical protein